MNKLYNIWIIPILLLVIACQKDIVAETPLVEDEGIVLTISCGELLTKATRPTEVGDSQYNTFHENYITTLDYFLYPEGGTGQNAVIQGRINVNGALDVGQKRNLSVIVSDADVNTRLFPRPSNKCVVYMIANYDGETDIHAAATATDIASLKALELHTANFKDINPGAATPVYHNFVMDGQAIVNLISRTRKVVATGEVELRRLASKIRFKVALAENTQLEIRGYTLEVGEGESAHTYTGTLTETWEPMTNNNMKAYLVNGVKYATMSGAPYTSTTGETNPAKHFSYNSNTYTSTESGTFDRTSIVTSSGTPVATTETIPVTYYVFDPYYSYPQVWTYGADSEAYIKLQLPWMRKATASFKSDDGSYEAAVNVGTTQKSFYYKVILPNGEFVRNTWYDNDLYVSILGSELDEAVVAIPCHYYVVDWNTVPAVEAKVRDARYLSVPKTEYVLYNTNNLSFGFDSSHDCKLQIKSITMPDFTDGSSLNKVVDLMTRTDPTFDYTFNVDENGNIVNGKRELILFHELVNEIVNTNQKKMDYGPITYKVVIYHNDKTATDPNYAKEVTIVQYPAIYLSAVAGGSVFVDGYFAHVYQATLPGRRQYSGNYYYSRFYGNESRYYDHNDDNGDQDVLTPYLNLYPDITGFDLKNLTRLTVTALSSDSNSFTDHSGSGVQYIIGDPRQASGWSASSLEPYLTSITSRTTGSGWNQTTYYTNHTTSWGDNASKIMIGTTNTAYIAPSILFSSAWSIKMGSVSFEQATKRCATYQEAGYPAGRWRLPTEAEVNFVQKLQAEDVIPVLFRVGSNYWTSSGYVFNGTSYSHPTGAIDSGVRCVYDVWYWGDTAKSVSTYWPEP